MCPCQCIVHRDQKRASFLELALQAVGVSAGNQPGIIWQCSNTQPLSTLSSLMVLFVIAIEFNFSLGLVVIFASFPVAVEYPRKAIRQRRFLLAHNLMLLFIIIWKWLHDCSKLWRRFFTVDVQESTTRGIRKNPDWTGPWEEKREERTWPKWRGYIGKGS